RVNSRRGPYYWLAKRIVQWGGYLKVLRHSIMHRTARSCRECLALFIRAEWVPPARHCVRGVRCWSCLSGTIPRITAGGAQNSELRGYWPASDTHFQTSRENFRNCFTTRLTPNARPRLPFESARRTERQWHATHWSACSGNEKTVTSSGARP